MSAGTDGGVTEGRVARWRENRWVQLLRTPLGATAAVLMTLVLLLAAVAPVLWSGQADAIDTSRILAGPSAEHWVGTDNLGRDLFFRVLVATRLSVALALLATTIALVVGVVLGAAPVLLGRRSARLTVAAVNIAVAFPGLLLALFFAAIFGVGTTGAVLAIGLSGAPAFARLCQTLVAGIAERDFVSAARIAGVGRLRLLTRHILPNIGEPLTVNATIGAGGALLSFAGLSFLGLGVQEPAYDWGRLLQDGVAGIYLHPVAALAPGIAVVVAGLAFNLVGETIAAGLGVSLDARAFSFVPGRPPADAGQRTAETGEHAVTAAPAAHGSGSTGPPLLEVRDLRVSFPGRDRPVCPVRGVSFDVARGESVGLVGESGSGKSLTALAAMQLIEPPGQVDAATLRIDGTDLRDGMSRAQRTLLGTSMSMVFQNPMTSFNPTQRIGRQLAEVARHHMGMDRRSAMDRAVGRLRDVGIPSAARRARRHPHEFSGGMRQRAMIALGLMGEPSLIVADEPTTALDVTVQQQVLDLLDTVRRETDVALVLISHDVSVVREVCDRVLVMYAGRIVEDLPAGELGEARHPYTRALVAAVPDMDIDLDLPLAVIPGRPVDPSDAPPGCAYAPRCPLADARCRREDPALVGDAAGRRVACWHAGEVVDADVLDGLPEEPA